MSAAGFTPGPWAWSETHYELRPKNPDPRRSAVHTILTMEELGCGFFGANRGAALAELEADRLLIVEAPLLAVALNDLVAAVAAGAEWAELEALVRQADTVLLRAAPLLMAQRVSLPGGEGA